MQSQVDGNTTLGFSLIVGWGGVGWGEKEIYATSKNIYNIKLAGGGSHKEIQISRWVLVSLG